MELQVNPRAVSVGAAVTMRLGIAGDPLPTSAALVTPALASKLSNWGVTAVALHLQNPKELLGGEARRIRALLDSHGISVSQFTGYQPNLVHPDPQVRADGLARLGMALAVAEDVGAEMVNTGCGSMNESSPYGPHPDNHTEASRDRLIESLRFICPQAEGRGLVLSLECHLMTTLSDAPTIRSIVEAVSQPALRVNFDPVNLLGSLTDVYKSAAAIDRMWSELGRIYARSAHVKDVRPDARFVLHLDEVEPGAGFLDWAAFFAVCKRLGDGAALIVEHLSEKQMGQALAFVRKTAHEHGVALS